MQERNGLPTPIPDLSKLQPKPLTHYQLDGLMNAAPDESPAADAAASIGALLFDAEVDTPFRAAEVEAQQQRFDEDRTAHLVRLRTYDARLAHYVAEAVARSTTISFGAEWWVDGQEGMPRKGSGLFYMFVYLAIPNQGSHGFGGGAVILHLTEQLVVRDAVLRIGHGTRELRTLSPELGTALLNVALHRGVAMFGPNYREELRETIAAALADRDDSDR